MFRNFNPDIGPSPVYYTEESATPCYVCGCEPKLSEMKHPFEGQYFVGYHPLSMFGEPVCRTCRMRCRSELKGRRVRSDRPASEPCLLCGHPEAVIAMFGEPVCTLCWAVVEDADGFYFAYSESVIECFVAAMRHELPPELRRPFVEIVQDLAGDGGSAFMFLRAFEIAMFDMGYVTMAAWSKGGGKFPLLRRPPCYIEDPEDEDEED